MEHMTMDATGHDPYAAHAGQGQHVGHDSHAGHDKHAGHDPDVFRRRFWLTIAMTAPVVFTSEMVMDWFGYRLDGVAWVGPVLGTVIYLWGGQPFVVSARAEVRDRAPGMMLLRRSTPNWRPRALALRVARVVDVVSTPGHSGHRGVDLSGVSSTLRDRGAGCNGCQIVGGVRSASTRRR